MPSKSGLAKKLAMTAAALVLLGPACVQTPSYQSTQQSWSELTDEERTQLRAIAHTFNDLAGKSPEEVRAIEPLVINVMNLGNDVILPFPEEQFETVTPQECPDDCAESHYVGPRGLTLDLQKLNEPRTSCEWGDATATMTMEVNQDALNRWFEEYMKGSVKP